MSALSDKIVRYATSYYEGHPEISDSEFDALVDELRTQEPDNPILNQVGWGYVLTSPCDTKLRHKFDVAKFESKVKYASYIGLNPSSSVVSVKIDGGSVCLYYVNGVLDYAITRGDGVEGYDITKKMKFIIPASLVDDSFTGLVRGEIAMKNSVYQSKYSDYSSARNLAIGIIKRNQLSLDEIRDVSFVAYTVRGVSTKYRLDSKPSVLDWIKVNQFECVDYFDSSMFGRNYTDDELRQIIVNYTKYPIDGVVVTASKAYVQMEDNTFVPIREVAYKTESDSAEVTVTNIEWNLTRTGRLFPRVWFTPVRLSGAVCRKATAFHAQYIEQEGIGIGSSIVIRRSGEIIPDIVEVLTKVKYDLPTECPECHHRLSWDKNHVHLICNNPDCVGRQYSTLIRWINTLADLKGLGSTLIDDVITELSINDVNDLYSKLDLIPSIYREGTATHELLKSTVCMLKLPVVFSDFIIACNLHMIGDSAAKALIPYKKLILEDPIDATWKDKLMKIPGVNVTGKSSIINSIGTIRKYAKCVQVVDNQPQTTTQSALLNQNRCIAITGKLSKPRNDFIKEIAQYGWSIVDVKKAMYLVTDNPESGSSKNKTAKQLGIKVISEDEFRRIMCN